MGCRGVDALRRSLVVVSGRAGTTSRRAQHKDGNRPGTGIVKSRMEVE
jgi:hypothetical protein